MFCMFVRQSLVAMPHFFPPSRGVRAKYANPLFDPNYPETGIAPPSENDPANLDPRDPDFEPDEHCPPQLLFPAAHRKSRRRRHVTPDGDKPATKKARDKQKEKQKSEWDTTDEEDNAPDELEQAIEFELPKTPEPRRSPRLAKAAIAKAQIQVHAAPALRMPDKHRSDFMVRAFGRVDKPPLRVEELLALQSKVPTQEDPSSKTQPCEDPDENPFL